MTELRLPRQLFGSSSVSARFEKLLRKRRGPSRTLPALRPHRLDSIAGHVRTDHGLIGARAESGSNSATGRPVAHQAGAIFGVVSREGREILTVHAMQARVADPGARHRAEARRGATVRPEAGVHVHHVAIAHESVVPPDRRLD
jgi:hypothetical protein